MTRKQLAIVALVLATTACGPARPLTVGMKEIDTNVLIGPPPVGGPITPREPAPVFGFPGIVEPPHIPGPRPPVDPGACPPTDPLAAVRRPTVPTATRAPEPGVYVYRNNGSYRSGTQRGPLPPTSTRRVTEVRTDPDGDFTFDVAIPGGGGAVTTTRYHVYPEAPNAAQQPGIYIERIETSRPGSRPLTFEPVPALELFRFPASPGSTWSAGGVDPFARTAVAFDAQIVRTDVIDVCGVRLQAWLVDVRNGSMTNPIAGTDVRFSMTLHVAPQYGGLVLADKLDWRGTEEGTAVEIVNTARITTEPKVPRS